MHHLDNVVLIWVQPIDGVSKLLRDDVLVGLVCGEQIEGRHCEVERVIEVPLTTIMRADIIGWEERARTPPSQGSVRVPYFEIDGARVRLEVPRAQVADVCRELLACGTVTDFSVQEIPIEEIIRQVFSAEQTRRKDAAAG